MFGFFSRKKEVEQVKEETRRSFESVKNDMSSLSVWIKYLDSEKNLEKKEVEGLKEVLSTVKEELEELKNVVSVMGELKLKQTPKYKERKQKAVYAVQRGVQTAVQTPNLEDFSTSEKAIIWLLLNADMKLSYEDLSVMLGKEKSTIRGQINTIKQKESIIKESVEKNGKKRVFIPKELKEKLLKKQKVRVKGKRKN